MAKSKEWLSTTQVARELGCHVNSVLSMIKRGVIEAHRLDPKLPRSPRRIARVELDRHMKAMKL